MRFKYSLHTFSLLILCFWSFNHVKAQGNIFGHLNTMNIGAILLLVTGICYWIIARRRRKVKEQQEETEVKQVINYFANSMSRQQTVDDILWDVARNCIGRLQFQDCVVYLLDKEKNELIQIAAHGPKSPSPYRIDKPLDITVGKGIVGSVALSGKAEIVNDTSADPRYIVDDDIRHSEITVPIVSNGQVLGVIDCEHSKKGFFTKKHLSILTTIASLCAHKIIRARTEEEKQESGYESISIQQKMARAEMKALRAQMNPHFIFNCLNSINRYIKNDEATAFLHLASFEKLIGLMSASSNTETIALSNEVEALKLYIGLEALRLERKFTYKLHVDENIIADSTGLPTLLIQPHVENAIWHGLIHKISTGHLLITISMPGDSMLHCIVEDNGIGREKSKAIKNKTTASHKSLGLDLAEGRLLLLNTNSRPNDHLEIIDLYDDNGNANGTRVVLKIPVCKL